MSKSELACRDFSVRACWLCDSVCALQSVFRAKHDSSDEGVYLRCGGMKKQSLQPLTGGRCPLPGVESGQLLWAETCVPEIPVDSAQCVAVQSENA